MMPNSYIDIFSGCGGLSLGLCKAGWQGLFAIEKNEDAFSSMKYNLIDKKKHFTWVDWLSKTNHDINIVLKENREDLLKISGRIPLIVGGPPCQGFSMAGQRNEHDHRNKLIDAYVNFIRLMMPQFIFFENVYGFTVGFLDSNQEKTPAASSYIVQELEKLGYNIKHDIVDLSVFGVPQRRKRFILFGCLEGSPNKFFDELYANRKPFLKKKGLNQINTVSDAIGDLFEGNGTVPCPDNARFRSGVYGEVITKYQKYIRKDIKNEVIPDSHRFAYHKDDTIKFFNELQNSCEKGKRLSKKNIHIKGFNRRGITVLAPNQPCNTLTSNPDDYLHFCEPRIMTVRECARIQTFPDDYQFKGKYTTGGKERKIDVPRYTQVANAIPPLFAEQVGLAIRRIIEDA